MTTTFGDISRTYGYLGSPLKLPLIWGRVKRDVRDLRVGKNHKVFLVGNSCNMFLKETLRFL